MVAVRYSRLPWVHRKCPATSVPWDPPAPRHRDCSPTASTQRGLLPLSPARAHRLSCSHQLNPCGPRRSRKPRPWVQISRVLADGLPWKAQSRVSCRCGRWGRHGHWVCVGKFVWPHCLGFQAGTPSCFAAEYPLFKSWKST